MKINDNSSSEQIYENTNTGTFQVLSQFRVVYNFRRFVNTPHWTNTENLQ